MCQGCVFESKMFQTIQLYNSNYSRPSPGGLWIFFECGFWLAAHPNDLENDPFSQRATTCSCDFSLTQGMNGRRGSLALQWAAVLTGFSLLPKAWKCQWFFSSAFIGQSVNPPMSPRFPPLCCEITIQGQELSFYQGESASGFWAPIVLIEIINTLVVLRFISFFREYIIGLLAQKRSTTWVLGKKCDSLMGVRQSPLSSIGWLASSPQR